MQSGQISISAVLVWAFLTLVHSFQLPQTCSPLNRFPMSATFCSEQRSSHGSVSMTARSREMKGKRAAGQTIAPCWTGIAQQGKNTMGREPDTEAETETSEETGLLFHVAPMQCYTNRHLRYLYRMLSSNAVLWTEMEKTEDLLLSEDARHRRLQHDPREHPLVLQLGGNDAEQLKQAARSGFEYGFDELNLNCGCPSVSSGGSYFGAALMRRPSTTRDLVQVIADASPLPVSVKCRIAAHANLLEDGTLPEERYETLAEFISTVASSGATQHFIVHARSAILAGLSPIKNRSIPPLQPEFVYRLCSDFPDLHFTLNGGISTLASVESHAQRCSQASSRGEGGGGQRLDGVMCGRWMLQRPLDLALIDGVAGVRGGAGGPPAGSRERTVCDAVKSYGQHALREACCPRASGVLLEIGGRRLVQAEPSDASCEGAQVQRNAAQASEVLTPLVMVCEQLKSDWERSAAEEDDQCLERYGSVTDGGIAVLSESEVCSVAAALWESVEAIGEVRGGKRGRSEGWGGEGRPRLRQLSKVLKQSMGAKVANKVLRNRLEAVGC